MNSTCLFCKIVSGDVSATIIYQDDLVTAFRDIHPVAPTHVLIVPNKHIQSINNVEADDEKIMGHLFSAARKVAEIEKISDDGFRTIINTGANAGQTVLHLHMHLIGGRHMHYPMG
ncbi:MAG: histidine triad nucleotide-binding protein [Chloroflexota bacterium]|jgi:histidine triad (HIT) family protein